MTFKACADLQLSLLLQLCPSPSQTKSQSAFKSALVLKVWLLSRRECKSILLSAPDPTTGPVLQKTRFLFKAEASFGKRACVWVRVCARVCVGASPSSSSSSEAKGVRRKRVFGPQTVKIEDRCSTGLVLVLLVVVLEDLS